MKNIYESSSLFMMQATLGASRSEIESVASIGIDNWLDEQLNTELENKDTFLSKSKSIWSEFKSKLLSKHGESAINGIGNNPALPYWYYFRMAWWDNTLNEDALHVVRSRIAQALSEIIVISDKSSLELDSLGMASFYDILYRNAFDSYGDILKEVSLHPAMGVYLSHMNNTKEDISRNIHPDENYAREIMQLFSIGLNELNPDGSEKMGSDGKPIPTYTNKDIKELAKVFTGLKASKYSYEWNGILDGFNNTPVFFEDGVSKAHKTVPFVDMVEPMVSEESYHDKSEKILLGGRVHVAAGQSAVADIHKVVDDLMNHPNTAPFISKKMIQQLVTSNPSNSYVRDVARAFGKSGNMKEMVRAILTHPEVKSGTKLKSPFLRATQILRAFGANNSSKKLWMVGDNINSTLQQHVLSSPTVFNFYLPDYSPHGDIESSDLVAPEFQIHNASTSIAYVNLMYQWLFANALPAVSTVISSTLNNVPELEWSVLEKNTQDRLKFDLSYEISMAKESRFDELISHLGLVLTGSSDLSFKNEIKEAFANYESQSEWVVQTIIFMIVIAPEYTVLKG